MKRKGPSAQVFFDPWSNTLLEITREMKRKRWFAQASPTQIVSYNWDVSDYRHSYYFTNEQTCNQTHNFAHDFEIAEAFRL